MSETEFVRFMREVGSNPPRLDGYAAMSLPRLLFHARNEGYDFTAEEAARVIGRLEVAVVTEQDHEPFDGSSTLWRAMWGSRYLDYLVKDVASRFTDEELVS